MTYILAFWMIADDLLIHIGHRNTDAMVLQNTLTASRRALTDQAIYFPKFATENREDFTLGYETHLVDEAGEPGHITTPKRDHWDRILARNEIRQNHKIIVSNCHYFKQITPQTVGHFDAVTNHIARNKKIIAYLCAPDLYFVKMLQQRLAQNRDITTPSRTRIKERIGPLARGWTGAVSLTLFSEPVLTNGNIVDDFFTHHLPDFDTKRLSRPKKPAPPPLSAEAIALLIDRLHGRLDSDVDPDVLVRQIVLADAIVPNATPPVLLPNAARTLRNWAAPDLAWLHDKYGVQFPEPGYAHVDCDDVDLSLIHFTDMAQICSYNADRKNAIYEKARARAKLPRIAQRLLTIW